MLGDVRPADETVAAISDARGNTGGGVTSDTGGDTGGEAFAVSCDPGSPDGVSLLVEEVMGRFGRCDVLVNCAGLMLFRPFGELDLQTWRRVQAVNVEAASKGAIVGFTRAMAVGLGASGITVNAIAPGLTRSPGAEEGNTSEHFEDVRLAQAVKRSVLPADMAGAVAFLASDDAAMISGQTIRIDGGLVTL